MIQSIVNVESSHPFSFEKLCSNESGKTLVIGFHGYAESGRTSHLKIKRLIRQSPSKNQSIDLLTPQGLHSFYGKRGRVVYSWMSKENRELHIQNNRSYFEGMLKSALDENKYEEVILIGYSQGVAMAWRGIEVVQSIYPKNVRLKIISVGGDIPPDICFESIKTKNFKVKFLRGQNDVLYTENDLVNDEKTLEEHQIPFESVSMKTGHRWVDETSRVVLSVLESE